MKKAGESPPTEKRKKENQTDQSQRFIETARELEADESGEAFERAMNVLVPTAPTKAKK